MKSAIEQKDKIIKELQQKVNSGNEKNRLVSIKPLIFTSARWHLKMLI